VDQSSRLSTQESCGGGQMSNHTPGPWAIEWDHYNNRPEFIRSFVDDDWGGEMQDIVEMSDEGNDSETLANANLIAAAPDMLYALKFLLADYQAIGGAMRTGSTIPSDYAEEAIKKAEGVK
jgi:hypothetical protein